MFAAILKTSEFWAFAAVVVSGAGKSLGVLDHAVDAPQTMTATYAVWRVVSKLVKKLPI